MCKSCADQASSRVFDLSSFLPSDQWEPSFPSDPERSAIPSAEVQQRTVFFLFLVAGQPAAAGHLWGSPAEQAEAFPDHTAAVWQRHFPRDRRQRPKPCSGPGGRFPVWWRLSCISPDWPEVALPELFFPCPLELNGHH